ncbi:MAG: cupin domain-containing protein [Anaerolineaceae bacterium]|jgi:quercetin dioxygenase-like cupin family protein
MSVKHSNAIPSEPLDVGKGARKAVLISNQEAPNFVMRKFTIQTGGSMPLHINLVEHEQYVLKGKALVVINGIQHEVQPGDVIFIPAEIPHSYETLGDEAFEFLCLIPNQFDETILIEKED